jgi:hypothetical protein
VRELLKHERELQASLAAASRLQRISAPLLRGCRSRDVGAGTT